MEITLRTTEFEPNEQLKMRAQQKVAKLQRYLPDLQRADIELSLEPTRGVETRRIVRVNLIMNGKVILRAEGSAADHYVAIDAAVDDLKNQVLRYKERREDRRHNLYPRPEPEIEEEEEEEEEFL